MIRNATTTWTLEQLIEMTDALWAEYCAAYKKAGYHEDYHAYDIQVDWAYESWVDYWTVLNNRFPQHTCAQFPDNGFEMPDHLEVDDENDDYVIDIDEYDRIDAIQDEVRAIEARIARLMTTEEEQEYADIELMTPSELGAYKVEITELANYLASIDDAEERLTRTKRMLSGITFCLAEYGYDPYNGADQELYPQGAYDWSPTDERPTIHISEYEHERCSDHTFEGQEVFWSPDENQYMI